MSCPKPPLAPAVRRYARRAAAVPAAAVAAAALAIAGGLAAQPAAAQQARDARANTAAEGARPPARSTPAYRLKPGDRLAIRVYGHERLTGKFVLDARGGIRFPLIGRVRLGGRTRRAAAAVLIDRLAPAYLKDPQVGIRLLNPRPVYVLGAVAEPGSYPHRPGLTVTEAVALAGGFTFRADRDALHVSRSRGGEEHRRAAGPGTRVLPGDTVHVADSVF